MINSKKQQHDRRFYCLATFTFLLWGTQHPVLKVLSGDISAEALNFWRFLIAAIFLYPFIHTKTGLIPAGDKVRVMLLGVIGIGAYGLLGTEGIARSSAMNSSVIINIHPLFTALLAARLAQERGSVRLYLLVTSGFIGILVLLTDGLHRFDLLQDRFLLGNCLLLAAAFCLSFYTVFLKKFAQVYGSAVSTFYAVCGGTAALFIYTLLRGRTAGLTVLSGESLGLLLYVSLVTTAFGWVVWFRVVAELGAARGSSMLFLVPVSGVICSYLMLGESISVYAAIGGVAAISAVILIVRSPLNESAI